MTFLLLAMLGVATFCGWRGWVLVRVEARTVQRPAPRHYTLSSHRKRLWIN